MAIYLAGCIVFATFACIEADPYSARMSMLSGSRDAVGKRELQSESNESQRSGKGDAEGQHERPDQNVEGKQGSDRDAQDKHERPEKNNEGQDGSKGNVTGQERGGKGDSEGKHERPSENGAGKNKDVAKKDAEGTHKAREEHGDANQQDGKGKRDRPNEMNEDKHSGDRHDNGKSEHSQKNGQVHYDANSSAEGKRGRPEKNGEGNHGNQSETEGKHGGKRGHGNHTRPEQRGEGKNGTKRGGEDLHERPGENREGRHSGDQEGAEGQSDELEENTGKSDSSSEDPQSNSPGHSADLGDEDNLRLTPLNNLISNSWNVGGVFDIAIASSMESAQVLHIVDQNRTLLEDVIAQSHGYTKVVILGVDTSRRLRSAAETRIRVRFQAESSTPHPERVVPTQDSLRLTLQQSFAKAGLDFQVQSAVVVITSSEFSEPDRREQNGMIELGILLIAGGLIMTCSCVAVFCLCKRQHSLANKVPKHEVSTNVIHIAPAVIAKSYDLSDKDLDLASVSTGTPGSSKSDLSLF